jgi:tetratricopeptide (TPR) repeat protein
MGTWFRRLLIATGALLWTCNIASAQHADRVTCVSATAPSDQAAAACTRVLARGGLSDTDRAVFLRDRSFVYDRKGEYDKAISDCNEAIRLKPDDAYAFSGRGFAYASKGEYDKAISDYDEAIRLKPDQNDYFVNRGSAYESKGEYDKAISDCNEAIRLKPDDAYAFDNRGIAYANKGEYDKAISDYDEAIRLKPDDADALEYRANVQVDRHEYDRAIADADEAIRLDLKLPNPHAARSRALLKSLELNPRSSLQRPAAGVLPTGASFAFLAAWRIVPLNPFLDLPNYAASVPLAVPRAMCARRALPDAQPHRSARGPRSPAPAHPVGEVWVHPRPALG